jgi:ELWxxDGT repeat protein
MKLRFIISVFFLFVILPLGAQATLVSNINPGVGAGSIPDRLFMFNGKIHFFADDGTNGAELWAYNGTNTPTMVTDLNIGAGSSQAYSDYAIFNSKLYFGGYESVYGNEVYEYDGVNPPVRISDICAGSCNSIPYGFTVMNNKLYFAANGPGNDYELYVYDGINPPALVYNINPTGSSSPYELIEFNSKLYFRANGDPGVSGNEMWVYDGVNTPSMVVDIYPGSVSSTPRQFFIFNNKLYFNAATNDGRELWVYDGINSPSMVVNLAPGFASSEPQYFIEYNGKLVFNAEVSPYGMELWQYDGVNTPTMISDINTGTDISSTPRYLTIYNNQLFFRATEQTSGREIWKYDGANPPTLVADINPGNASSTLDWNLSTRKNMWVINGKLVFAANDGTVDEELYEYYFCPLTNTVTQNGLVLTATETGATYQWIDCNNSNQPIAGETNQTYTATANGNYAVIISNGTCSDTSACTPVNSVGIPEISGHFNLSIYPNPTTEFITLTFNDMPADANMELINPVGQVISTRQISQKNTLIQLPANPGLYFIRLTIQGNSQTTKIIKQ